MLIYPVFPKHNFLKKACIQQGATQHRYMGRRNRPRPLTLPQIGGEKMKYTPDGYGERCRFDAFCKTVLRNEARTHLRDLGRQRNREIEFSALSQQEMDKLCTVDEYPSDSFLFTAYGYALHIEPTPKS